MIDFFCPNCNGPVSHPSAGEKIKCPYCDQKLRVPKPPDGSGNKTVLGSLAPPPPSSSVPVARGYAPPPDWAPPVPVQVEVNLPPSGLFPHSSSGYAKAHRGGTILALGIISLVAFSPLGPFVWHMANVDLALMHRGVMDPAGQGTTEGGKICGICASVMLMIAGGILLSYLLCCGLWAALIAGAAGGRR
jgi:DNA-directed RNA polymerase subunit RPC12/RpoP